MSFSIGLIGCGKWSTVITKEIENSQYFNLKAIVCRNKNKEFNKSIKVFSNTEDMIDKSKIKCAYIAATPEANLNIIKLITKRNLPVIIEKPITNNFRSSLEVKKIAQRDKKIIMPNLSNIFSDCFQEIENFIKDNKFNISKIIVNEGNLGPFRQNVNPVWDWGFHSISLIFKLFKEDNISTSQNIVMRKNNYFGNGLVVKFDLIINNSIKVKILTGNLFKKKNRNLKIILKNNDFLMCDFVSHEVFINKKLIFKSKITPLSSLFKTFYKAIKSNNYLYSEDLIDTSIKTTKFLEKFYKC